MAFLGSLVMVRSGKVDAWLAIRLGGEPNHD